MIAQKQKDFALAHQLVDRLISAEPKAPDNVNLKLSTYFHAGDVAQAKTYLDQALARFPNDKALLLSKAHILAKTNMTKAAEALHDIKDTSGLQYGVHLTKFKYDY
jgi:predicted Zn-dependent protease